MTTLLEVKNLVTRFYTQEGVVHAVNGISYSLNKGESMALVGESGCGKSVSALSLLGLVPSPPGIVEQGEVLFNGTDLLQKSERELRHIRGGEIGMVFQDPMTSLNPVLTVAKQLQEGIRLHLGLESSEAEKRAIELLNLVGIPDAENRLYDYPHQFSGGQRQRIMIAMALSCDPALLIADEPTTALDVIVQRGVIQLLKEIQQKEGSTIVLITHDLGVHANLADRIAVLYAGKVVEEADTRTILKNPRHPYTQYLIRSLPNLDERLERVSIPGRPPALDDPPSGCRFHPRCPYVMEKCREIDPKIIDISPTQKRQHRIACHLVTEGIEEENYAATV